MIHSAKYVIWTDFFQLFAEKEKKATFVKIVYIVQYSKNNLTARDTEACLEYLRHVDSFIVHSTQIHGDLYARVQHN